VPIDRQRQGDTKLYHTINIVVQSRCLAMHLSPVIIHLLSLLAPSVYSKYILYDKYPEVFPGAPAQFNLDTRFRQFYYMKQHQ